LELPLETKVFKEGEGERRFPSPRDILSMHEKSNLHQRFKELAQ